MLELGTMYTYGLNDRLQHVGNVSHSSVCTTVVKVMVTSIVLSLLFIAPGYQIYINYLLNVNN